ncbi:Aminodeoxychorismate synthase component 1 [bacterium HR17]|uniref:aminodeoxychorismate synthase n=1 Tax=Candidatus Fervidibacter japonicus TaxID=2035412 RepID=A0A2H5XB98_9BACT|nr:Aminodeoxychorismate synthase component 1 [bacterium HR17]
MVRRVELPFVEPLALYRRLPLERQGAVVLHSGLDPLPQKPFRLARYCFFATEPFVRLVYRVGDNFVWLRWDDGTGGIAHVSPWQALRALWATMRERLGRLPDLPTPLPCGLIGFLSYDLRVTLERLPLRARRDVPLPDMWFCAYGAVLTVDLRERRVYAVATGLPAAGATADRLAAQRLERLVAWAMGDERHRPAHVVEPLSLTADMNKDAYRRAVEHIRDYIAAGDVYQVNFAHRFRAPVRADPSALFLRLCEVNPAPFAAFLNLGDFHVLSVSPERFLHFDPVTRIAQTRPIKGTRPRGATPADDAAFADELLHSEKDRAEHLMIVDLERNDLGRIAEIGSVQVADLWALEAHPTVWHLVSTVQGRILPHCDVVDVLQAMFPGGSVTGAPKVRAMEIIDELEPVARNLYTGCIGYWSFTGHCDFNIAIRTITVHNGVAFFHVGGGIVADSDPDAEYDETLAKAQGMARALGYGKLVATQR